MNAIGTTYSKGAVIGRTRKEALVKLAQEQRAGRIHSAGELALITRGDRAGQYAVPVYLIVRPRPVRPEMPRWARACLVIGVLLAVPALLLGLLLWVLATLSTASLALFLGAVLAAFLGWLRVAHGRPARGATVTTTVTFH